MRVALEALGCKLNQAETESLARCLRERGYELVSSGAEVYILNTCTVTQTADAKSRKLLRRSRIQSPGAFIIATGCYAQRAPQGLQGIVDLVVPNPGKPLLAELVQHRFPAHPTRSRENKLGRTRSQIKIQDGCDNFCTYCIVPQVRGREQSLPPEKILQEVKERADEGYLEVVLTGTNMGNYHWNGTDLERLLRRILAESSISRLRLSSLQPQHLTPSLLSLWQDSRLCPHFHLPLQSGSNPVLREMGRRYSGEDFQQAVTRVREALPQATITSDVIVGFPGEGEEEFEESLAFCQKMAFARIHVFPYSPREGTAAAEMPQIEGRVKLARTRRMLALAREGERRFQKGVLGQTLPVLWERQVKGIWSGLADNYLRVLTQSPRPLANTIALTRLTSLHPQGFGGEVLDAV